MADPNITANIGSLDAIPSGEFQDADLLEVERPVADPAPNDNFRATFAQLVLAIVAKLLPGSGIRINTSGGVTTISSGGAAVVDVTASTTLGLSHADRFLRCNSAAAITITVPAQATVAWPDAIQLEGCQWGAGAVTFVGASGVNVRRSTKLTATTDGQYTPWGLKRVAENEWLLFGQMGAA